MNRAERRRAERAARKGRSGGTAAAGSDGSLANLLQQALAHHQRGDFARAKAGYERVLARQPDQPDALQLLGVVALQAGDLDQAETLLSRALKVRPNSPQALNNLGTVHKQKGDAAAALACFREAVKRRPEFPEALGNLATLEQEAGRLVDAEMHLRKLTALAPDDSAAAIRLCMVLVARGKTDEAASSMDRVRDAIGSDAEAAVNLANLYRSTGKNDVAEELYRRAIELAPDLADAPFNLALLLSDADRLEEAEDYFAAARRIDPGLYDAAEGLGRTLAAMGRPKDALEPAAAAWRHDRDEPRYQATALAAMAQLSESDCGETERALIGELLRHPGLDKQMLAPLAADLLMAAPAIRKLAAGQETVWRDALAFLATDVPREGLAALLLPDPDLERALTLLRAAVLDAVSGGDAMPDDGLDAVAALARHCFLNEYVFAASDEETARLDALRNDLSSGARHDPAAAGIYACYAPLGTLDAATVERISGPALAELIRQQVDEPAAERGLAKSLPTVGAIRDATSAAVRTQYEENPYPRWDSLPATMPAPLADIVVARFPGRDDLSGSFADRPEILIAGCGTGRQALVTARGVAGARVLAVDLSRASLAFAKRKAEEIGVGNVDFRQADILALGELGRRFDFIECTGVLHHMADPLAGWRVLAGLLEPHGIMRIALYSETARRHVVAARTWIGEQGFAATAEDIRACRRALAELPADHPAAPVVRIKDFYALSACRDLLFHVQESRFTVPQIAEALDSLDLDFVGFEPPAPEVARAYRAAYPDDTNLISLDHWHAFEQAHPDTFTGMYDFWCRPR